MGFFIVIGVIVLLVILFSSGSSTPKSTYTAPTPRPYTGPSVLENPYKSSVSENTPVATGVSIESKITQAISGGGDIKIRYRKYDGTASERRLSAITYNNEFEADGYHNAHIKGYCHLRKENRTFKIDRIIAVEVLN